MQVGGAEAGVRAFKPRTAVGGGSSPVAAGRRTPEEGARPPGKPSKKSMVRRDRSCSRQLRENGLPKKRWQALRKS